MTPVCVGTGPGAQVLFGGGTGDGRVWKLLCNAESGSDTADGTSPETAFRTLEQALKLATDDDVIFLMAGQHHFGLINGFGGTIDRYGAGADPVIDSRLPISDLVWTEVAPDVYRAEVRFRNAPTTNDGAASAFTTHHQIWLGDQKLQWVFGEGSIADNLATVGTQPGTFTLHYAGSDVPDPRDDGAGSADFTVYVHLPDGSPPTANDLYIADVSAPIVLNGADLHNVTIYGGYGKDMVTTLAANMTVDDIPTFDNVTILDVPAHGIVGPVNATGTLTVSGRGAAGHPDHVYGWNSSGGLVNIFTNIDFDTVLTFEHLVLSHGARGLFGHNGREVGSYDGVEIGLLELDTVGVGIQLAGRNDTPFVQNITVDRIEATAIGRLIYTQGDASILGGHVEFATGDTAAPGRQSLVGFMSSGQTIEISDLEFSFGAADGVSERLLAAGTKGDILTDTLVLTNVKDLSAPEYRATLQWGIDYSPNLILMPGTELGDLQQSPSARRAMPASLTAWSDVTFGLGARTGVEIEKLLHDAGIAAKISSLTTIVDANGNVLSSPGWEHAIFTTADQTLDGTDAADFLIAGAGDDIVRGYGGDDLLESAQGDDQVYGDDGDDTLVGGAGKDEIHGGGGSDRIYAGIGGDAAFGDSGDDRIWLGDGNDEADGSAGDDEIFGEDGNDSIKGGTGSDRLHGGLGDDVVLGENGNDVLHDGAGDDVVDGGTGNDTLVWHGGNDLFTGGNGADVFVIHDGDGKLTLDDFNARNDTIDLSALGIASLEQLEERATMTGDVLTIELSPTAELEIQFDGRGTFQDIDFLL